MSPEPTVWDAATYDATSAPQQSWDGDVLARLSGVAPDARVLDVACGTGRVTEQVCALVPDGEGIGLDASREMVALAPVRRAPFASAVADRVQLPLDYLRLNVSAVRSA